MYLETKNANSPWRGCVC